MHFTSCSVFCFWPGQIIAGKPLLFSTLEAWSNYTPLLHYGVILMRLYFIDGCSHTLPTYSFDWKDDMTINDADVGWNRSSSINWYSCQSYLPPWIGLMEATFLKFSLTLHLLSIIGLLTLSYHHSSELLCSKYIQLLGSTATLRCCWCHTLALAGSSSPYIWSNRFGNCSTRFWLAWCWFYMH